MTKNLKSILTGIWLLLPAAAMAVPARPVTVTVTQPDGSTVEIIKRGDERSHTVYTADGVMLFETDSNGYFYAMTDNFGNVVASPYLAKDASRRPDSEIKFLEKLDKNRLEESILRLQGEKALLRAQRKSLPGLATDPKPFPNTGENRSIVVLVEFADKKFTLEDPHTHFNDMLNKENYTQDGATGSARSWFIDNSSGVFKPTFDVYGPIELPNAMSYYGRNDRYGNDQAPEMMAVHALEAIDAEVDLSQYDTNGDGDIDNVYVFYAGYGENDGGSTNTVWPHSYDVSFEHEEDFLFDGVRVNHYACSNELRSDNGFDGIGTFVHEFSHVLGLPDLYHTISYSTVTPGKFSVLDEGPYNNEGKTPPNYSIYERTALGWMEAEQLTEDGNYTLKNIADSNHGFLIRTDKENEYFLFENRQQTGWDTYLPAHGMLIWHIDYDEEIWNNNTVNNVNNHQHVDIVEADNRANPNTTHGDTWPGSMNVTTYGPSSIPAFNTWAKKPTGYTLSEIAEANGEITFTLDAPEIVEDPNSVNEITSTGTITGIHGGIISTYAEVCRVYDASGRPVASIPANSSVALSAGIYIVTTPDGAIKIAVK